MSSEVEVEAAVAFAALIGDLLRLASPEATLSTSYL
jgi:hypothetical protein